MIAPLENAAAGQRLFISGAFHPGPKDGLPGVGTLVLLSPAEPGFWAYVTASAEFSDGLDNPLDRWSQRVVGQLAKDFGATAHFPFGGPPYAPFYDWALRSGRAWASPVALLVHDEMGLFASYRGALAFADHIPLLSAPSQCPCVGCAKPCLHACPAAALGAHGYNVPACHEYLDLPAGKECLSLGCSVRSACPASLAYGRLPKQSAWHMRQFHT
ncbi:ferredoxin [Phaeovulum sp.]|uniref:ferredoxin n=1 Tax=Phaeovulum sp. TaxID=2934796 RepID=UPI0039E6DBCB